MPGKSRAFCFLVKDDENESYFIFLTKIRVLANYPHRVLIKDIGYFYQ